jgi:hypothetical protein
MEPRKHEDAKKVYSFRVFESLWLEQFTIVRSRHVVIPAKAGIQILRRARPVWIPAFAGMTEGPHPFANRSKVVLPAPARFR